MTRTDIAAIRLMLVVRKQESMLVPDISVGLMSRPKQLGFRGSLSDEASCVVFGMPKEAIKAGAVDKTLPLSDIAGAILAHVSR